MVIWVDEVVDLLKD